MSSIHISKSDKYQRLDPKIKWIGGAYSETAKPFWDEFDPIYTSKNADDIIRRNAIKTLITPLSDEKKQKLIEQGKPFDQFIIKGPALSAMDNLSKLKNEFINVIETFYTTQLPESWKNYTDDLNSPDKRLLISTRPMNQQSCGSCYAFACASAINDVFIFGPETRLKFNPNISPMTILSCVAIGDNSQCNGGVPISTLQYISENGVLSSHCINYYETLNQKLYVPKPGSEMNVDEFGNITYVTKTVSEVSTDDLTNLSNVTKYSDGSVTSFSPIFNNSTFNIPACQCFTADLKNKDDHYQYFIEQPDLMYVDYTRDSSTIDNTIYSIKQYLFTYGTGVVSFFLRKNFIEDGTDFKDTKGIYIETELYQKTVYDNESGKTSFEPISNPFASCGGHAICLVGWGVEKDVTVTISSGKTVIPSMPYWVCRNSWGQTWGDNGYFKIAMYQKIGSFEINPTTSLEKLHTFQPPPDDKGTPQDKIEDLGGIIIFKPKKTYAKYDGQYQLGNKNNSFYKNELSPVTNPSHLLSYKIPPPPTVGRNSVQTIVEGDKDPLEPIRPYLTKKNLIIFISVIVVLLLINLLHKHYFNLY
jgi:hypothetical protein